MIKNDIQKKNKAIQQPLFINSGSCEKKQQQSLKTPKFFSEQLICTKNSEKKFQRPHEVHYDII